MKPSSFVNCINYNGLWTGSTGSIMGIYDFLSGSGNANSPTVVYNLIHPTGYHFSGNNIYDPSEPLISVGRFNSSGYSFTGQNVYRLGLNVSGDYSFILDIEYSGCTRNTTDLSLVLFSTSDNLSGINSGFYLGINDLNRLFFATSGYTKTIPYELKSNNIVYVGFGQRKYVEFGVLDLQSQTLHSESVTLDTEHSFVNKLYVGGFLNNNNTAYTGYSGKIYNAVLANRPLDVNELNFCSTCIFATGVTSGTAPVTTIILPLVTGHLLSGQTANQITGYTLSTGTITKADNSTINVVFPSGMTGLVRISDIATVLTGTVAFQVTGATPLTFLSESRLNSYVTFDIELDYPLESGDYLEIYTYPQFNPSVNQGVDNLDFPTTSNYVQLFGNGLIETKDVDYSVVRNKISGFSEEDILGYDVLTGRTLVSPFSGYWLRNRIIISGITGGTGTGFYPISGQFRETTGATGKILITGITGQRFYPKSDLYLNGQKLVSGYHYVLQDDSVSGYFGRITGLCIAILEPNTLPDWTGTFITHTNGYITGIDTFEDSELTIVPRYDTITRYFSDITGTTTIYQNVTGFSEQIWVNGIRQTLMIDYTRNYSCTQNSGIFDYTEVPFNFYDNYTGYFNII